MGLAVLKFGERYAGKSCLNADIGKNRYYVYAVGGKETIRRNGLKFLQEPPFKSRLFGPIPENSLGRVTLEIPDSIINDENQYVQLISFRSDRMEGPTVSEIVRIPGRVGNGELPVLNFSMETEVEMNRYVESKPFSIREKEPYSHSMFLGALAGLLPQIIPAVAPLLGGLFGGKGGGGTGGGLGPIEGILKSIAKPETVKLLTDLIGQLTKAKTIDASATGSSAYADSRQLQSYGLQGDAQYSTATAIPIAAIAQLLPALMPVLKQVLSPETIKNVLDTPNKGVQTVINGLKDFAKMGAEFHEKEREHLRKLNPGIDTTNLGELLASMSLGMSQLRTEINYERVDSVTLNFEKAIMQNIFGSSRIAYCHGKELVFPLAVETPRTIGKAVLQFIVKDAETLEILIEKREHLQQVSSEGNFAAPAIAMAEAAILKPNKDYLVHAALIWKNSKGKKMGASKTEKITLVGEYTFDRMGDAVQVIPLDDPAKFRDYWHKILHVSFTEDLKKIDYDCRYYYLLKGTQNSNARLETKMLSRKEGNKKKIGYLKSGYELSPDQLNALLSRIEPAQAPLTEAELLPLRSDDFSEIINQAARYKATIRGRAGDSAMLWAFPSVRLQRVIMKKVIQTTAGGNVTKMADHETVFPIPVTVNFVGVKTI